MKLEQHKNVFYKNIGTYMALINNELKKEYPLEPLSNHIKMVGGYAFKSSHYLNVGIPVIRISDFQNEKIVLTGVKYYEESDDLDRYELAAGDVIIAMTGGTIGKLAIVQDGLGKLYLNQRVGKFQVLNSNEFEDEYVYWLARGIQDIVQNLGYGGAQPNVSNKQIEALEFAFPERKIQKQIIAFLNDLKENKINGQYFNVYVETKIINLQVTSVKLNTIKNDAVLNESFISKLKESILKEAVLGKLTEDWRTNNPVTEDASHLLKRIQEEKAQLIKEKKIKREKKIPSIDEEVNLSELPKGWVWCRMGQVGNIMNSAFVDGPFGSSINTKKDYIEKGIPVLRMVNVKPYQFKDESMKFVSEEKYQSFLRHNVFAGDILFSKVGAGIGESCIVPNTFDYGMLSTTGISRIRVGQVVINEYLCHFINGHISYFKGLSQNSAQPFLNMTQIKSVPFPLPPLEEQKVIVQKVNALMRLCNVLEQEIQQSQQQSDKLTQSVMRESVEVNTTF